MIFMELISNVKEFKIHVSSHQNNIDAQYFRNGSWYIIYLFLVVVKWAEQLKWFQGDIKSVEKLVWEIALLSSAAPNTAVHYTKGDLLKPCIAACIVKWKENALGPALLSWNNRRLLA